ncbi:MAG TPA: hypothetical protein PLW93_04590, partial [Candidatus Absconditabacterales bacterium]|nr:hypothetical protein [Candidatus Absconditabacterales bacterium]
MTLSGVIITLYALTLLLPTLRERISGYVGLSSIHPIETHSKWSTIILGSSLGLVFNSCSPTYILIIATIFPSSFTQGVLYTIVYCLGFGAMLWLVSIAGFKIITSFKLLAN